MFQQQPARGRAGAGPRTGARRQRPAGTWRRPAPTCWPRSTWPRCAPRPGRTSLMHSGLAAQREERRRLFGYDIFSDAERLLAGDVRRGGSAAHPDDRRAARFDPGPGRRGASARRRRAPAERAGATARSGKGAAGRRAGDAADAGAGRARRRARRHRRRLGRRPRRADGSARRRAAVARRRPSGPGRVHRLQRHRRDARPRGRLVVELPPGLALARRAARPRRRPERSRCWRDLRHAGATRSRRPRRGTVAVRSLRARTPMVRMLGLAPDPQRRRAGRRGDARARPPAHPGRPARGAGRQAARDRCR